MHDVEAEVTGHALEGSELGHGQYRRRRADEAQSLQVWYQLLEQSHALLRERFLAARSIHHVPGRVPARTHVALRKPRFDRIGGIGGEDQRQVGRDLVNGEGCRSASQRWEPLLVPSAEQKPIQHSSRGRQWLQRSALRRPSCFYRSRKSRYDPVILENYMTKVSKRTFSLPAEQSAYIDAKVESGAYASSSEVIRAGLRALQERDAAVERWLRDEVAPVYDAMKANPERKLSAKAVFAEARARYAPKKKARR